MNLRLQGRSIVSRRVPKRLSGLSEARTAAARIAGGAELVDIRAVEISAELGEVPDTESPYDVRVEVKPSYWAQPDEGPDEAAGHVLVYSFMYDVKLVPVGAEQPAAVIGCRYNAAYHWRSSDVPAEDELRAFGETSVLLALYPYVRQLVHDITGRFNLDALVMPLYKEPLRMFTDDVQVASKKKGARRIPTTSKTSKAPSPKTAAKRPAAKSSAKRTAQTKKSVERRPRRES